MKKKPSKPQSKVVSDSPSKKLSIGIVVAAVAYVLFSFKPASYPTSFDLNGFGALPTLQGGRIKPLDTVARVSLLMIHGKQTLSTEDRTLTPIEWFLDVLYRPDQANAYPLFRIDNPDVLGAINIQQTQNRYFSFNQLQPFLGTIEQQVSQIEQIRSENRSSFQTALNNLQNQLILFQKLENTVQVSGMDHVFEFMVSMDTEKGFHHIQEHAQFLTHVAEFFPIPQMNLNENSTKWVSVGAALLSDAERIKSGLVAKNISENFHPALLAFVRMGDATRAFDPDTFNSSLIKYSEWLKLSHPTEMSHATAEQLFNRVEPFYKSMILYVVVALLTFFSWLRFPRRLNQAASYLLWVAFIVHSVGLISRIILQGRPPVTNLYSSAIFVGWVAVILGLILERLYKNGVGNLVSATVGFLTLIIAHHLASTGDTMEMMRAVLDSNFWLATHVVCVTIGYSSTFLAGFISLLYIMRRVLKVQASADEAISFERMVYGIVCFSTFFSFLGTILGGIWADQSWGRFWGWDPKENGALLIVIWNALILHAKWGRFTDGMILMVMAVFGNIITAFSWFGVNMLGIGLHSYGFMDKAFVWLMVFIISQVIFMIIGFFLRAKDLQNNQLQRN